jgi:hypothetical protein
LKKIIQVYSAAYSGSTMLELMIGNAPDAFVTGEVWALYNLDRRIMCSCGDGDRCPVWSVMRGFKDWRLYPKLAEFYPEVNVFTDSSKMRNWFRMQRKVNRGAFDTKMVAVFKHPWSYLYSVWKRKDKQNIWAWYTAYREVLSNMRVDAVVEYEKLAADPSGTLRKICEAVGVEYFDGKELFWNREREHHLLYGSGSAVIHLHEKGSRMYDAYVASRSAQKPNLMGAPAEVSGHRSIYFDGDWLSKVPPELKVENEAVWSLYGELLDAAL